MRTFEQILKLIQESAIDLYTFKPGSVFKFVIPTEVRNDNNDTVEVSPKMTYTVTSIDEDNGLVNVVDQIGTELSFSIDSIFDTVEFLSNGDLNEAKRNNFALNLGQKVKFNKKDISYSEFEDIEISKDEIKSIENKIGTIISLDMDNSGGDNFDDKKDFQYFSVKFDNGVELDAISGYHLTPINTNENSSYYKISQSKGNKNDKYVAKKGLQFETTNSIDAMKKAKALGLVAIETPDGIEIEINSKDDKINAIKFLQNNGYGEKDGYNIDNLYKMFPILN